MTQTPDMERLVRNWLDTQAPPVAPADLLESVMTATARTRQQPAWLPRFEMPPGAWVPTRAVLALTLLALLAAVAVGTLVVLSQPPAPPSVRYENGLVAFVQDRDVYTMNADGSGRRQLTSTPLSDELYLSWSPDGRRLAYVRCVRSAAQCEQDYYGQGPILAVDAGGGPEVQLVPAPTDWISAMAWSPDGTRIAYLHDRPGILSVTNLAGGASVDLLSGVGSFAWSPDGMRVVVSAQTSASSGPDWRMALFTIDLKTDTTSQLTDGSDVELYVSGWSPDGASISFTRAEAVKNGPWRIESIGADGTDRRVLNENVAEGAPGIWSPDGSRLAFTDFDGTFSIAVMEADGSGLRTVRRDASLLGWSPDGQFLVARDLGREQFVIIRADGSGGRVLGDVLDIAWQARPR